MQIHPINPTLIAPITKSLKLEYDKLLSSFAFNLYLRRYTLGDRKSVELGLVIKQALETAMITELLPRSQVDINIQVLQADGGVRAAAINAAVLAIADAGIPLRDTMASCAAGYLDGTPLLDLNYLEEGGGGPEVYVVWPGIH